MGLAKYQRMRDFSKTPEPKGKEKPSQGLGSFVVQKHDATRLHYDFRLELDGVLVSWAVPKGPSLDPKDKRLAVHVEDHPIEYGDFEGVIPAGEYGGGPVIVWDRGRWAPIGDPQAALRKGEMKFLLAGEKLKGKFVLVRLRDPGGVDKNWLLIKEKDEHVRAGGPSVVERLPKSVKTGRGIEELVEGKDPTWHSNRPFEGGGEKARRVPGTGRREETRRVPGTKRRAFEAPKGAKKGAMPARYAPHEPKTTTAPPEGDDWLHEIAFEGRRALLVVAKGKARLLDPAGKEIRSSAFAAVTDAAAAWPVASALVDGMLCHVDAKGRSSEAGLADALSDGDTSRLRYFAFDLLHADGTDLRGLALVDRKDALTRLLGDPGGAVLVARHHRGDGGGLLAAACERGLRGVVSKRADSVERPRREDDWRVTFCAASAAAGDSPSGDSAAEGPPSGPRAKAPAREARAPAVGPAITNPNKVLWPDVGVTKRELVDYYGEVAERMMPLVSGRPLMLLRCPDGVGKPSFVQKHLATEAPPGLVIVPLEEGGAMRRGIALVAPVGLTSLVQLGALEIHGWGSRAEDLERPDHVVFDFDPAPDVPFSRVMDAAREVRRRLKADGLASFVATTGGKGLHVHVPLAAKDGWDVVKPWTRAVAERLERDHPSEFVSKASKAARTGRIFVDWLRNGRGATAIVPYSARARAGATVGVPLSWDELTADLAPAGFTVRTVPDRVAGRRADPWRDYRKVAQRVPREGRTRRA